MVFIVYAGRMKLVTKVVRFVILGLMLFFFYALWTKFTAETSSLLFLNTLNLSAIQEVFCK